jgi:hypothetical protein
VAIISTKVDQVVASVSGIDLKVDSLDAKMQRVEGVVALVRWLGAAGVAIAVIALLKAFGLEVGK